MSLTMEGSSYNNPAVEEVSSSWASSSKQQWKRNQVVLCDIVEINKTSDVKNVDDDEQVATIDEKLFDKKSKQPMKCDNNAANLSAANGSSTKLKSEKDALSEKLKGVMLDSLISILMSVTTVMKTVRTWERGVVPCDIVEINKTSSVKNVDDDEQVATIDENLFDKNSKQPMKCDNNTANLSAANGSSTKLKSEKVALSEKLKGVMLDPFDFHLDVCDGSYEDDSDGDEDYDDEFNYEMIESVYGVKTHDLAVKFDKLDLTAGAEATITWFEKDLSEIPAGNSIKVIDDEIALKFKAFKQFDSVSDSTDHYFHNSKLLKITYAEKKPGNDWAKRIQKEWKVLEKDLPGTIYVRIYEDRMDLLRAVIIGPDETPYHDGLFFFDLYFPPTYPLIPPNVHYHSGGLRLNPNLYNCGRVCLSLLNTWPGKGCERWDPINSTILQVLVSIQALVLNAKPYFNEPGNLDLANTPKGEKKSLAYNEKIFILSCRTMLYSLRKPPKHFEDFVAGHFKNNARNILLVCKAYANGAKVGSVGAKKLEEITPVRNIDLKFKTNLGWAFEQLLREFVAKGADCEVFLGRKSSQIKLKEGKE